MRTARHTLEDVRPRAIQQNVTSVIARRALTFSPRLSHQRLLCVSSCSTCTLLHECGCCHERRVASNGSLLPATQIRCTAGRMEQPSLNSSLPSDQPRHLRRCQDGDAYQQGVRGDRVRFTLRSWAWHHSDGEDLSL